MSEPDSLMQVPSSASQPVRRGPSAEEDEANNSAPLRWSDSRQRCTTEEKAATDSQAANDEKRSESTVSPQPESTEDTIWVEFEEDDDPRRFGDHGNPFRWSRGRRWAMTILLSTFTFNVAFSGSSFPIGVASMQADLGVSHELAMLAISMYPLGFAMGPMALAPFSEEFGRNPVYIVAFFFSFVLLLPIGLAPNITSVLINRFLAGIAGSTGSTMVGGSLSDIWETHERGLPMSIFSFAAFAGSSIGPALMGYVAQNLDWRWIQHIQVIYNAVVFVAICLVLRESRGTVLLRRRAQKLRKETGDMRYKAHSEVGTPSLATLIRMSLSRPIWFLFSEPVVTAFSIWIAFAWGVMWGLLEAIPYVMSRVYGFNTGEQGLAFFGLFFGAVAGTLTNIHQEGIYKRKFPVKGPEARLYYAMAGSLLLPAGCFIFAWSAGRGHWMGPLIGSFVLMVGIFHICAHSRFCLSASAHLARTDAATFNYLADAYLLYASSAIAAQSFLRNIFGFTFPLFTVQMYDALGYDWATFLFGCVGLLLSVVPFVLFRWGPQIRSRSKVVQQLRRDLATREAAAKERAAARPPKQSA